MTIRMTPHIQREGQNDLSMNPRNPRLTLKYCQHIPHEGFRIPEKLYGIGFSIKGIFYQRYIQLESILKYKVHDVLGF